MTAPPDWGDSARQVVELLRGAVGGLAGHMPGGPATASTPGSDDPPGGSGGDCRWCPVCQFTAVLRGERPEVTAALADVLTATAQALHAFAAPPEGPAPDGGARAPGTGPEDAEPERPFADPPPSVQRIHIA